MKKFLGFVVILVLAIGVIRPLLSGGYFPMHDDTQIARVVGMGNALREGQFPVRWVSGLGYGYGYPIFNFYGPLPYYVGGIFYSLGLSGLIATKLMMGIGLILSGVIMYFVLSEILGISAGILGSTLYMYAPYKAVDAYVRGAVGEYYALIFLPLIFLGFWRIIQRKSLSGIVIGALGLAGLVTSHTILGFVGVLGTACISLVIPKRKYVLAFIILGLGMSAFFWLPAIMEMKYTNVSSQISATANFRDHYVCLWQLWESQWGYGGSAPGCLDGLSFKLGKIHLILALLSIAVMVMKKIYGNRRVLALWGVMLVGSSIFLMLRVSQPVWEIIPMMSFVQYPWRLIAFAVFGLSFMGSLIVTFSHIPFVRAIILFLTITIVLGVESKRFNPQYLYGKDIYEFESEEDIGYRASKISDEYLPKDFKRPQSASEIARDTISPTTGVTLEMIQSQVTYKKYESRAEKDTKVKVNIATFPGWHYWVNENEVLPEINQGIPYVNIPTGLSVVQFIFKDTPVRKLANSISIVSLLVYCIVYDKRKKTIS